MIHCSNCGKLNKADARFCNDCGSQIGSFIPNNQNIQQPQIEMCTHCRKFPAKRNGLCDSCWVKSKTGVSW